MGVKVYREDISQTKFIPVQNLQAPVIVISRIRGDNSPYLFAISCDTHGPEPEHFQAGENVENADGGDDRDE